MDEGTAIFKCDDDVPTDGQFLTYDGLPSEVCLRLVRGEITAADESLIRTKK